MKAPALHQGTYLVLPSLRKAATRAAGKMEQTKETNLADQGLIAVVITLTVIVFILDLLTPSELAVWTLYVVPLGISRWSYLKNLPIILAIVFTALLICAHLYDPGPDLDIAIFNRVFGLVMVWATAFFLWVERF